MADSLQSQNLQESVRKLLNSHGHPFAAAVVKRALDLHDQRISFWKPEVAEFPVQVHGVDTHIDFTLRSNNTYALAVCECKRALDTQWVFARTGFSRSGQDGLWDDYITECCYSKDGKFRVDPIFLDRFRKIDRYDLGLPLTGNEKDPNRNAVNSSCTQVMRGVNGLIEYFAVRPEVMGISRVVTLLPVIFTTADLLVTDVKMDQSSLDEGKLPGVDLNLKKVSWLYFQYNQSQSVRHHHKLSDEPRGLSDALRSDFQRTIIIANANDLEVFLPRLHQFLSSLTMEFHKLGIGQSRR